MFFIVTGLTIGEYIRRRKLTLAGQDLAFQRLRVIDVALKYGYETLKHLPALSGACTGSAPPRPAFLGPRSRPIRASLSRSN